MLVPGSPGKSWTVYRARVGRTASWRSRTGKDGQDLGLLTAIVGKLSVGECSQGKLPRGSSGHHLVADTVLQESDGGVIPRDP